MSSFIREFIDDPDNDFNVYCYLTTLGRHTSPDAKFLLMIEKKEQKREDKIKSLLQNVHKMYTVVGESHSEPAESPSASEYTDKERGVYRQSARTHKRLLVLTLLTFLPC